MYEPTTFLVKRPGFADSYMEFDERAEAYRQATAHVYCDACGLALIGRPRVTFEHRSKADPRHNAKAHTYLTVTDLDCAPVVWARLHVAAEAASIN